MAHHINIGGRQGRDYGADEAEEPDPMTPAEVAWAVAVGLLLAGWVFVLAAGAGWLLEQQ